MSTRIRVLAGLSSALALLITGCPAQPVVNKVPDADAGGDQTALIGATVVLTGSNSTDPDGDDLDFSWEQVSGTPVTINNSQAQTASFVAPLTPGVLIFRLTVDDDREGVDNDQVSVVIGLT